MSLPAGKVRVKSAWRTTSNRGGNGASVKFVTIDGYLFDQRKHDSAKRVRSEIGAVFQGWDTDPEVFDRGLHKLIARLTR
jgi:hypothetical protein